MAIQWTFPQLDYAPSEGDLSQVVKTVHWRASKVHATAVNDEGSPISATAYGTASVGDASADSFTAFDSLTQEQVKGWVLASLDKTEEELEAMLNAQMEAEINPPIIGGTPAGW
jgi:hypothetical protein